MSKWLISQRRRQREPRTRPIVAMPEILPGPGDITLALDPSSTAVGWAVFRGDTLWRCGRWRPKGATLEARCAAIADAVHQMILECDPISVVIERTSGIAYKKERAKSLYALSYAQGVAVGSARGEGRSIHVVTEQGWTNRVPKKVRASRLANIEPVYAEFAQRDTGQDAADAVGVGRWWLNQIHIERLMRGA